MLTGPRSAHPGLPRGACRILAGLSLLAPSSFHAQSESTLAEAKILERLLELRIAPAEMRPLIEEALRAGDSNAPTVRVEDVAVSSSKVVLRATASLPTGDCPLEVIGVPVVRDSTVIGLDAMEFSTDGFLCQGALVFARPRLKTLLSTRNWQVARRVARASQDPALPGPRLPSAQCLVEQQIRLANVRPVPPDLHVAVLLYPQRPEAACP